MVSPSAKDPRQWRDSESRSDVALVLGGGRQVSCSIPPSLIVETSSKGNGAQRVERVR